jgi:hypothetical protein
LLPYSAEIALLNNFQLLLYSRVQIVGHPVDIEIGHEFFFLSNIDSWRSKVWSLIYFSREFSTFPVICHPLVLSTSYIIES